MFRRSAPVEGRPRRMDQELVLFIDPVHQGLAQARRHGVARGPSHAGFKISPAAARIGLEDHLPDAFDDCL